MFALALSPDNSIGRHRRLVRLGEQFDQPGHRAGPGRCRDRAPTCRSRPTPTIINTGTDSAITSLTSSPEGVYGTGYGFQQGPTRLEGTFRANWNGDLDWLEDCHGDSYGAAPFGGAVYVVSHAHFCQNVGGYPQTDPPYRALAWSRTATSVVSTNTQSNYKDYGGQPAPSMLHWFPTLTTGTYTGQDQAAWTVTVGRRLPADGRRVPDGQQQAGARLDRFTTKANAANKFGPAFSNTTINPVASIAADGAVRLTWTANVDRDNKSLRYDVIRNGDTANPVTSIRADSLFWLRPTLIAVDRTVAPNTNYTYQVIAVDPFGNKQASATTAITTSAADPTYLCRPLRVVGGR